MVVFVTFSSETGETSNQYHGVRITPFVNLKKRSFLDVLGVEILSVIEWIFDLGHFFVITKTRID